MEPVHFKETLSFLDRSRLAEIEIHHRSSLMIFFEGSEFEAFS